MKEIRTLEVIYDCDYIIDAYNRIQKTGAGAIKFPIRILVDSEVEIEMVNETQRKEYGHDKNGNWKE